MSTIKVECRTAYYTDYNTNSDKFYRTYVVDDTAVFQWGRRGTVGQFKTQRARSEAEARQFADTKMASKRREGYSNDEQAFFDFDPAFLNGGSKDGCVRLDDVRQAAAPSTYMGVGNSSSTPAPAATAVSTPVARDPYGEFTARALAAISLAVTDPVKGATEYAKLNADWPELEQLHAKAQSYLKTLDSLIMGVPA